MKPALGYLLAFGLGAGMLLLGNLAEADSSKESRLKKALNLLPATPIFLGSYVEGQKVSTPGVYVNETAGKVFATPSEGNTLVFSEKATLLYQAVR